MSANEPVQPDVPVSSPSAADDANGSATPAADLEASNYQQAVGDEERTNYQHSPTPGSAEQIGSWSRRDGRDRDLSRRFGNNELLAEIARDGTGVACRAR